MHKASLKIAIILGGIIVLPLVFYITFQASQLNREERIIEEIYSKQLEAILFSINQYSNDLISTFSTQIELGINYPEAYDIQKDLMDKYVLSMILNISEDSSRYNKTYLSGASFVEDTLSRKIKKLYDEKKFILDRLKHYKRNNFTKLESLGIIEYGGIPFQSIVFMAENEKDGLLYTCNLLINPEEFIESLMAPRISQVADEKFIIQTVRREDLDSSFPNDSTLEIPEFQTKQLWLFNNYSLIISTKEKSIGEIAKERTKSNVNILIILIVVLIIGFVLIFKNLNREVQLAQNKSDFASSVSHEIRTPLALISMFAETLIMDRVSSEEKKKEYYQIIVKESSRLRNIVNKILNFSQTEAGKKTYNFELCNLTEITNEIVDTYSFHLQNKSFQYKTILEANLPFIKIDKEAITEAIINLLDNAIKYSPEEKRIVIKTGLQNQMVFVEVKDKGIGIDPKKKKQIFDKFYRVTKGNIYNVQGAGLGLSLVKQIISDHKGKIEIDSQLGQGSCFRLLFPVNSIKTEVNDKNTNS